MNPEPLGNLRACHISLTRVNREITAYICSDKELLPIHFGPVNPIWVVVLRYRFWPNFGIMLLDAEAIPIVGRKTVLTKSITEIVSEIFYMLVNLGDEHPSYESSEAMAHRIYPFFLSVISPIARSGIPILRNLLPLALLLLFCLLRQPLRSATRDNRLFTSCGRV